MASCVGMENFVFLSGYNSPILFWKLL